MTMELLTSLATRSEDETLELGRRLGALLAPGHLVGLVGELGAGKTCLARGIARGAGVPESVRVTSPTFTLVNEYPGRHPLYHLDLYRLTSAEELVEAGVDDCLRGEGICLVEWLDRFAAELFPPHLEVRLALAGRNRRLLAVSAAGAEHLGLGRRWLEGQP